MYEIRHTKSGGKSDLKKKMPALRHVRDCLLLANAHNIIDDEEFAILYDYNKSKNPDFPYWNYNKFDLEKLTDDECKAEFRFYRNDVYNLLEALQIPETFRCSNGLKLDGIEATCILLRRFSYPARFGDLVPRFGRPAPQLSMIISDVCNHLFTDHHHRLQDFRQPWLSPRNLQQFSEVIHAAGAPLQNCFGFVDGTVRPVCRPGHFQRVIYNGHKRVHAIKFQAIVTPNGLIANLFGPVEGRRHDSGMLADSGLLPQLEEHCHTPNNMQLCIYGDMGYPLRPQLQTPFRGANITPEQNDYNNAMSKVRTAVEWVFGDILNYYKFMDFKENLKLGLSPIGKMYIICALLTNAHTCLYGSTSSSYFDIAPPTLEEYFN